MCGKQGKGFIMITVYISSYVFALILKRQKYFDRCRRDRFDTFRYKPKTEADGDKDEIFQIWIKQKLHMEVQIKIWIRYR